MFKLKIGPAKPYELMQYESELVITLFGKTYKKIWIGFYIPKKGKE